MPRPPSLSLAICLRCQFRYSHPRLQLLPRRPLRLYKPTATFFTTTSSCRDTTPAPRELIVLEPPGPWKPLNRRQKPLALDDSNLESGANELLTFEYQTDNNALDATQMEISLYCPNTLRMSRERYQQVYQELNRAFLRAQLYDYYSEWLLFKPEKRVAVGKTMKKSEILNEILRNIWEIEVTDEIAEREDVLINKEVKSCRRDIFFMIGEDGRVLRNWAQKYSTRITVNVQTSAMHFRGSLANIERLESAMQDMLQNIVTEVIDLSWVSRLWTFNEEYITPIARLTNTFIEKTSDNTIRVVALGPERHAIDDARRLLFTSLDMQFRSTFSLLYNSPRGQESLKGALYPFTEDPSLPWRFRGRNWARWRNVKSKPKGPLEPRPELDGDLSTIKMKGERSLEGLKEIHQILLEGASPRIIEAEVAQQFPAEYQAILGCLLHDSDGGSIPKSPQTLEEFVKGEYPRVLSNEFPGVSFMAQAPISRNDKKKEYTNDSPKLIDDNITYSFSLRFAPSPWANPNFFENYPLLEMLLKIDTASGEVLNPKLVARHSESVVDILMPSRHCDLRFLRRVDIPLSLDIGEEDLSAGGVTREEMARFMDESNINPAGNSKLRSSSQIKASIPPWMMQSFPGLPTTEIDYFFIGMEFRRVLHFDWEGMQLQHTIIEGGTSGGRKTEVKLVCKAAFKAKDKMDSGISKMAMRAQGAVEQELGTEAQEQETVAQALEMEELRTSAEELEGVESELPAEAEDLEMQSFAEVSDSTFSKFVKSTMTLVKSLESRFTQSMRGGNGIQR